MDEFGDISFYLYDDYSGLDFFGAVSLDWTYLRAIMIVEEDSIMVLIIVKTLRLSHAEFLQSAITI